MSDTYYFNPEQLCDAVYKLCQGSGSPHEEADLVAKRLIKSNLTGHPSHGVMRLAMYMRMIRGDMIKPGAIPELMQDHGSTAIINGNRAYGQVAAEKTMRVAIDRGLTHGIAAVGVTNLAHIGRLADYAISAARDNCVGLVFTSGGGVGALVAPFEGSTRRMDTNPLAMAVPTEREHPIVFDMATSVWAEGKFRVLRASGKPAPEHTLVDKEGQPTTNPHDFYEGGAILPLGGQQGYKGYLLNFMVEVMAGLLTGGGCIGAVENPVFNNCTMMIVISVERFRELPQFRIELEKMITYLKESPVLEGKEVLYPGELEVRLEEEIRKTGISLPVRTVGRLQEEMDHYGVSVQLKEIGRPSPFS
ncbi:MAG: Ldh family oxidoreductase [Desulfobacteraceae bacterium]|nr:Ldh family oxidoreductase [Desulfobacteraceae bacterium]